MNYENINSIGNTTHRIKIFFRTRYVCFHAAKSNSIGLIWK